MLDIAVDIRKNSATFGKYIALELSEENKLQLFIPAGFAHGYVVLSKEAIFSYKVDNYYHKESERGIIYNDSSLQIDWKLPVDQLLISEKDTMQSTFKDAELFEEEPSSFSIYTQLTEEGQDLNMAIQTIGFNDVNGTTLIPVGINLLQGQQVTISMETSDLNYIFSSLHPLFKVSITFYILLYYITIFF